MADSAEAVETGGDDEETEPVELPTLEERIEWFEDWEEQTREPQRLSRRDRDYRDGKQWTREELDALAERGQPPSVNNRIARKVNTTLGDEIDKRVDPQARPRSPEHAESARVATDALRYVVDEQKFDLAKTAVTQNVLVEGYGGALKSIADGKHRLTHVEWDRLFYDPHSRRVDFSDAKFKGIVLWQDLSDAIADHPDAEDALRAAVAKDIGGIGDTTADTPRRWVDRKDNRVKLVEMFFRVGKDWYRSVFTAGVDIEKPARTAYLDEKREHSVCPLLMTSCYIDQEGMRYGIVRNLISRQDAINKRESKALYLLSVKNVMAERDVVREPEKFMREIAKPDGFAEVEAGALTEGRIQVNVTTELAQGHIALMQQAINDIDGVGPNTANADMIPQEASGRAILARQKAASKEIQPVFDSLRMWTLAVFQLDWQCIRQYWTEEKWMRVTDDNELDGYRFVALNRAMTRGERFAELMKKQPPIGPDQALKLAAGNLAPVIAGRSQMHAQAIVQQAQALGQQAPPPDLAALILSDPLMQQEITVDQVDQMDVDIVMDTIPDTAIIEQEEFEQWTQLAPSLVQAGFDPREAAKMTIELSQFRDKKRVLETLNKPPPPGQQQQQQAIKQLQQQMAQLQAQLVGAQIQKTQADAELSHARAQSEMANAGQAGQPEMPKPHEQIAAQREQQGAQIDLAKAQAQIEKEHALTQKHQVDTQINVAKAQMQAQQHALAPPTGQP